MMVLLFVRTSSVLYDCVEELILSIRLLFICVVLFEFLIKSIFIYFVFFFVQFFVQVFWNLLVGFMLGDKFWGICVDWGCGRCVGVIGLVGCCLFFVVYWVVVVGGYVVV